jgi:hypothetical protein
MRIEFNKDLDAKEWVVIVSQGTVLDGPTYKQLYQNERGKTVQFSYAPGSSLEIEVPTQAQGDYEAIVFCCGKREQELGRGAPAAAAPGPVCPDGR